MNFPSQKIIIILLVLIIVILAGSMFYTLFISKEQPFNQAFVKENGRVVFQPNSPTAAKYYPGGGNAMDFRDGAQGDFKISMENKSGKIILSWPNDIKAYSVTVYDLGDLANMQDTKIVFQSDNYDRSSPGSQVTPSGVYLAQPYQAGTIVKGFFDNTLEKQDNIFVKDKRYSIEIYGLQGEKMAMGSYTFTY